MNRIKNFETHPGGGPRRKPHGKLLLGLAFALGVLILILNLMSCSAAGQAERFNESASSVEYRPEQVLAALELKPGMVLADLGAGGGYYSLQFARRVGPDGKVYALDVNRAFLDIVQESANKENLSNLETRLIGSRGVDLPGSSVDLVFIRDVYHHLENRVAYFRELKSTLKPGGRVAIIDYIGRDFFSFVNLFGHTTAPETIAREMRAAGYRPTQSFDFLEKQSFQIFSPTNVEK